MISSNVGMVMPNKLLSRLRFYLLVSIFLNLTGVFIGGITPNEGADIEVFYGIWIPFVMASGLSSLISLIPLYITLRHWRNMQRNARLIGCASIMMPFAALALLVIVIIMRGWFE